MKNILSNKEGFNVFIKHKNTEADSLLFGCNKIEYLYNIQDGYIDHHLLFFDKGKLIFKVWLGTKKKYKDVNKALKDVDIKVKKL